MRVLGTAELARRGSGRAALQRLGWGAAALLCCAACSGFDRTTVTEVGVADDEASSPVADMRQATASADEGAAPGVEDAGEQLVNTEAPGVMVGLPSFDAGSDAGALDAGHAEAVSLPYPADWCSLFGVDFDERYSAAASTTDLYISALLSDCRVSGLVELEKPEFYTWLDYLFEYTNALFGCPPLIAEPPGGIAVFALGNAAGVGVPARPYAAEEAELLVRAFLDSLSEVVPLGSLEEQALFEYLSELGRESATLGVVGGLSVCETPPGG